jgi:hypothetical protein
VLVYFVQDGFINEPAAVADRVDFDLNAYVDSKSLYGPVSAIYYTATAGK